MRTGLSLIIWGLFMGAFGGSLWALSRRSMPERVPHATNPHNAFLVGKSRGFQIFPPYATVAGAIALLIGVVIVLFHI